MTRFAIFSLFLMVATRSFASPKIKIQGSTTVNPVVTEAAEHFRKRGWEILVDTQGGSSGGITALGEGLVDLAMSSKPLAESDKVKYPKANFKAHMIGIDGVGLAVSNAVFEKGVFALDKKQLQAIYEGKITNWKTVGGPDRKVVFFNKEPGRGTWEVFAHYLYGDPKKSPAVSHAEVGSNEEGRAKVAASKSAITQLSISWILGSNKIAPLSLKLDDGTIVKASLESIANGTYPMKRELLIISNGQPSTHLQEFIDFITSDAGQKIVEKNGYLRLPKS